MPRIRPTKPVAIAVETSVLDRDFRLQSRNLTHLIDLASAVGVAVWIPKVTVGEIVSHYPAALKLAQKNLRDASGELNRFFLLVESLNQSLERNILKMATKDGCHSG